MGILTSLFLRLVPLLLLILIGKYNRQLRYNDPSYFRIDTQAGDNNLTSDGGGGEEKVNSKSYDTSYNVYNVDRLMVDLLSSSPSPSSTLPSSTLPSLLPSSSTNQKLSSSKIIILAGNMDPILSTNEKNNEYKYSSSFQAAKLLYQTNTLRSIIIGCFNVTLCTNEIVDYDDTTKRPTKKDKRTNLLILPYDARNIQSIQNFAFHVVQYVTTGKMQQHHHQQQEQEQEQEQEQQKLQQQVQEVKEVQEEKVWSYYKPSNIASQILKVVQTGQIMEKKKEEGREEVQEEKQQQKQQQYSEQEEQSPKKDKTESVWSYSPSDIVFIYDTTATITTTTTTTTVEEEIKEDSQKLCNNVMNNENNNACFNDE